MLTAAGVKEWAGVLVSAIRGRQRLSDQAHITQGKAIIATFDAKHRFELDGGCKGRAKQLEFAIQPSNLRVCTGSA